MPRRSRRNILDALAAVEIDVAGKGANVSDDIQLVYVLDDIREPLYAYGAIGEFTASAGGRIHILQIECRNPRGLIIDELVGVNTGSSRLVVKCNTQSAAEPNILPAPLGQLEPLGISEGRPTAAEARSGTVPSGQFNGGRPGFTVSFAMNAHDPIYTALPGALHGLFIGNGRFLVMLQDGTTFSQWSLRWHELG